MTAANLESRRGFMVANEKPLPNITVVSFASDFYIYAMRSHVPVTRPTRQPKIMRRAAHPTAAPRPLVRSDIVPRIGHRTVERCVSLPSPGFQTDPYPDYGRYLTREGGILFIYKDIDDRIRHTVWRLFAWTMATGLAAVYLAPFMPLESEWMKSVLLLSIAIINWLIVKKPVEVYHRIEIRPDCMIIEGVDVFWARFIEGGFPAFRPDQNGNQVLCGIYGTRNVDYLTVRRFDEHDRMAQVFAAHLQDAMRQLWSRPR